MSRLNKDKKTYDLDLSNSKLQFEINQVYLKFHSFAFHCILSYCGTS